MNELDKKLLNAKTKEEAEALIVEGANVDAKDGNGDTVLMRACSVNNLEVVEVLFKHNVKIDSKGHHGETALMRACYCGCIKIVEALLEKGADINIKDGFDCTAINFARTEEMIRLLKKVQLEQERDKYRSSNRNGGIIPENFSFHENEM